MLLYFRLLLFQMIQPCPLMEPPFGEKQARSAFLIIFGSVLGVLILTVAAKVNYDYQNNIPDNTLALTGYTSNPIQKKVLLIGDSILDSAYWNDVDRETTGEVLRELLGDEWIIDDRSAEKASTATTVHALKTGKNLRIEGRFVRRRDELGIPYDPDFPETSRLKKYHHRVERPMGYAEMEVDIRSDIAGSIVFISLGGNDVGLVHNLNPYTMCNNLAKISRFYKEHGARKVFYLYPYSPTLTMALDNRPLFNALTFFHNHMKPAIHKTVKHSAFDGLIDLSDFGDRERWSDHLIPEPTKAGALLIAERIQQKLLDTEM